MSKQGGKQRTLDFFMKKGQSDAAPTNKSATSSSSASKNKTDKTGKTSANASNNDKTSAPGKASTNQSAKQTIQTKSKPSLSDMRDPDAGKHRSLSPVVPYGFSSSRSVASDARSTSSGASRETPPTSEIFDVDMMDEEMEEQEEITYKPVR